MANLEQNIVLGSSGLIGQSLVNKLSSQNETNIISLLRSANKNNNTNNEYSFDLESPDLSLITNLMPATLYICAGNSKLQSCESDPVGSWKINVDAIWDICRCVANYGGHIVYLSSSQVYQGDTPAPNEHLIPAPTNHYGIQKLEIEKRIQQSGIPASIIRLSKILDAQPTGIFLDWINALAKGQTIKPATNMWLSPVSLDQTVDAIHKIGSRKIAGIWNFSSLDQISYAEAARLLAESLNYPATLIQPKELTEVDLPAKFRQPHTNMNVAKVANTLNMRLPKAKETLSIIFKNYDLSYKPTNS